MVSTLCWLLLTDNYSFLVTASLQKLSIFNACFSSTSSFSDSCFSSIVDCLFKSDSAASEILAAASIPAYLSLFYISLSIFSLRSTISLFSASSCARRCLFRLWCLPNDTIVSITWVFVSIKLTFRVGCLNFKRGVSSKMSDMIWLLRKLSSICGSVVEVGCRHDWVFLLFDKFSISLTLDKTLGCF